MVAFKYCFLGSVPAFHDYRSYKKESVSRRTLQSHVFSEIKQKHVNHQEIVCNFDNPSYMEPLVVHRRCRKFHSDNFSENIW